MFPSQSNLEVCQWKSWVRRSQWMLIGVSSWWHHTSVALLTKVKDRHSSKQLLIKFHQKAGMLQESNLLIFHLVAFGDCKTWLHYENLIHLFWGQRWGKIVLLWWRNSRKEIYVSTPQNIHKNGKGCKAEVSSFNSLPIIELILKFPKTSKNMW